MKLTYFGDQQYCSPDWTWSRSDPTGGQNNPSTSWSPGEPSSDLEQRGSPLQAPRAEVHLPQMQFFLLPVPGFEQQLILPVG